jgi:hypothetical protein
MKLDFSRQVFEKYSNVTFHENPPSGSRVVACGRTDGQTDMTKLIAAFRHFPNAPKNELIDHYTKSSLYIDWVNTLISCELCWLRHCATRRKIAGSIPDGVIGIFI